MKHILVICEPTVTATKLIEFYNFLFPDLNKKLFFCAIELSLCKMEHYQAAPNFVASGGSTIPPKSYLRQALELNPVKSFKAEKFEDVAEIIRREKIDLVLVPNYLYDYERSKEYSNIIKLLKRKAHIEVLGLYI